MPPPTVVSQELRGHVGAVQCVRFNTSGGYCMSAGSDKTVRLWNPHKGTLIKSFVGHGRDVHCLAIATDNSKFASGGLDSSIYLWDIGTGREILKIRGHVGRINAVQYNPEATLLITASYDATVKIWDLRAPTRDPIQDIKDARDSVSCLVVTAREILAGSVDGTVRNYDIRAGRLFADSMGSPVTSARFSHDNNCILVSTLDHHIRLMDKDNGEMLSQYTGHKNDQYKVESCLTYTDEHVVSGSEDGRLCFWGLVDGKLLHAAKAHEGVVTSVDSHPTENCVLSASVDGGIKLWRSK